MLATNPGFMIKPAQTSTNVNNSTKNISRAKYFN